MTRASHSNRAQFQSLKAYMLKYGFWVAFLLLFGCGIASYVSIQRLRENRQSLVHTRAVIENLQGIIGDIVDAELGRRGQIITKDPIFVIGIDTKIKGLRDRLKNLHQLIKDNPNQQKHFAIVDPLVNQRIEVLEKSLQLWQQDPNLTPTQVELTYQGWQLRQKIEARIAQMKKVEDQLIIVRSQAVEDSVHLTLIFVILASVTGFSLFVVVYLLLTQEVAIRRQAELQLQQNNQDLEQKVEERTAELQKKEQLFRLAIFNAPLPITLHIEDEEFLLVNQAWTDLSGYAITDIPTVRDWTRQAYGERQVEVDAFLQKSFTRNKPFNSEDTHEVISKEGKRLFWDYYSAPLDIQPNGKRLWITIAIDVTDRKLAEEALRASQRQYETLAEVVPVGIFRADLQGNSIYANSRVCEILGINLEETMDMGWSQRLHPEDRDRVISQWQVAAANRQKFYAEYRFISPDGSITWVITQAIPEIENDIMLGYVGTITEVNSLKSVEKELQATKADLEIRVADRTAELSQRQIELETANHRWQSLLDNVRLLVLGLNSQGNIEYVNPFFLKTTGYETDEVIGKNVFSLLLQEHEVQSARSVFTELITTGDYPHYQNQILTKAGKQLAIAWNNTALRDSTGKIIGSLSIGADITDELVMEKIKSEFISVVSHELRTPLASIRGALGLLASGVLANKPDTAKHMLDIAIADTERLVRLVNDILDLERLESNTITLDRKWWNTSELCQQAMETMQAIAEINQVQLSSNVESLQIFADRDRIIQTLVNLLSNAIKFSPAQSEVSLTVQSQNDAIVFHVQDHGRGIPIEHQESIFDRFKQVDVSDSRQKGGTGLGLAICRSIVQQHNGKIWVESDLTKGSTFSFTIPHQISSMS
ncbi:PAS domain S-box protein [Pseudanabaena sp. Chao 1811]|uniref:PAS domain S-box protein n=1 Tax=Pseudanabaena sp. Chao 1811 TaxID=2963092 RepID=UPI0022F37DF5|nr:PAS domain S-box protein [Pseudanabaena sp. Chao 1811]